MRKDVINIENMTEKHSRSVQRGGIQWRKQIFNVQITTSKQIC